jgi:glucose uptake protein GlcU
MSFAFFFFYRKGRKGCAKDGMDTLCALCEIFAIFAAKYSLPNDCPLLFSHDFLAGCLWVFGQVHL